MKKGIDYIGVAAGAIIFNEEGKVFLAKRGQLARNEKGKWEFPGGGVEFGERLEDAVIREMKEEFGIKVEPFELLGVNNHLIPDEKQHWVAPSYLCRITSGVPQIMEPGKIDEIGWFALKEVEKMPISIVSRQDLDLLKIKHPEKFN